MRGKPLPLFIRPSFGDNGGTVQLVLQVFGGLFLLILFLIVVTLLFIRWKMKQFFKGVANAGGPSVPLTLELVRVKKINWADGSSAGKAKAELVSHGFTACGSFTSERIPGLKMAAFVNEVKKLYAVLYEHPAGMQWVDVVQRHPKDKSVTVTSATVGEEVESPPWSQKITLAGRPVSALMEEMERHQRPDALYAFAEEFEEVFAKFYERSMKWQVESGAINNPDDITEIADMLGVEANESDLEGSRQILQERDAKMKSAYLEAKGLSAAEWEGQRPRTVFVHSRLKGAEMDELLSSQTVLPDGTDEVDEGVSEFLLASAGDARTIWKEALTRGRLTEAFRLDHSMEDPYPCDVYVFEPPAGQRNLAE